MKTLKKSDLEQVLVFYGLPRGEAKRFVENFFDVLTEAFKNEGSVKISGFGTFKVIHKKSRIGQNIHQKTQVVIPERQTLSFKPSTLFKKLLNDDGE